MFERFYEIKGITVEMYEAMKGTFRDEFLVWRDDYRVHAHARLSILEAFKLRREITKYNLLNDIELQLVRV